MLRRGVVKSPQIITFLKHLHRHVRGPVIVIWDGLHAHHGLQTKAFIDGHRTWLTAVRLPAYSPELNPVEGMWSWFKGGVTANFAPDDLDDVAAAVRRGRRQLDRRPARLMGFLAKSGYSLG
jgi:transposase